MLPTIGCTKVAGRVPITYSSCFLAIAMIGSISAARPKRCTGKHQLCVRLSDPDSDTLSNSPDSPQRRSPLDVQSLAIDIRQTITTVPRPIYATDGTRARCHGQRMRRTWEVAPLFFKGFDLRTVQPARTKRLQYAGDFIFCKRGLGDRDIMFRDHSPLFYGVFQPQFARRSAN